MRYVVISKDIDGNQTKMGIVFHDVVNGLCFCRSNRESFMKVFNFVCKKTSRKAVKDNNFLRLKIFSLYDYGYLDSIIKEVCKCDMSICESGDILNIEDHINKLHTTHLS